MEKSGMEQVLRVSVDGRRDAFPKGSTVRDAIERLWPEKAEAALCALHGGVCLELNERLTEDCDLRVLTYQDEEGRRVYERSLRFLFLLSMKRLYPQKRVRILNSVGYGVYLRVLGEDMDRAMIAALEQDMRALAAQNLPFEKERWTREQAIAYFEQAGYPDKADILRYRPVDSITMYRIGEMREYFYGAMVPSTGYLKVFALKPHFPGLVLRFASPDAPDVPAPYLPRAKHLRVFGESQEWCRILGASNIADVNRMIEKGGIREFIRVNEALHDKSIAHIADEIVQRGAQIVLIFGPSSSGKTTFTHRLKVHLRVLGKKPQMISLDDFYRDRDSCPIGADGKPDLECIDALDVPYLSECFEQLLGAQLVQMPRFDFTTGKRAPESYSLSMAGNGPLLVEGIHALNDKLTCEIPEQLMFGIYVSALPCLNLDNHNRIRTTDVRLLRRIVRDMKFRNTPPEQTIDMWPSVRAGEEKWIFPNQEKADVMFNTSLHYELPILKTVAYDVLERVKPEEPEYLVARRLLKILNYVLPVEEKVMNEIPPLSILREFIGECTFYDRH